MVVKASRGSEATKMHLMGETLYAFYWILGGNFTVSLQGGCNSITKTFISLLTPSEDDFNCSLISSYMKKREDAKDVMQVTSQLPKWWSFDG